MGVVLSKTRVEDGYCGILAPLAVVPRLKSFLARGYYSFVARVCLREVPP